MKRQVLERTRLKMAGHKLAQVNERRRRKGGGFGERIVDSLEVSKQLTLGIAWCQSRHLPTDFTRSLN